MIARSHARNNRNTARPARRSHLARRPVGSSRTADPPPPSVVPVAIRVALLRFTGAKYRAMQCPRQESNLGTRFRKPTLYPLSYGGRALQVIARGPSEPTSLATCFRASQSLRTHRATPHRLLDGEAPEHHR